MPSNVETDGTTHRILGLEDVEAMVSLSGDQISKLEQRDEFPRRVPLSSRRVGWVEAEVQDWIMARMKLRDDAMEAERLRWERMPPGVRHRLRMQRDRESEKPESAEAC
jgi:prophage regulatory protein